MSEGFAGLYVLMEKGVFCVGAHYNPFGDFEVRLMKQVVYIIWIPIAISIAAMPVGLLLCWIAASISPKINHLFNGFA